ncbi:MAG TPA: DNA polymerase III subunit [Flavobacteriales bacterium]|mgnify:CR=1 FL=1|nr:DNA polymerase III subunit [Flavobacteriales bacterium]HPH82539.1 DNA polymerase III subunit [Flavobacteriales bacterium]
MQFAEIPGHDNLKQRLLHSVHENRIPHAQLFAGPEGSAALPLAIAFAQFVACENRSENDSCGHCGSCVKFRKLAHPDLHFSVPVNWEKPTTELHTQPFLELWRAELLKDPYLGIDQWVDAIDIGNKQPFISNYEANEIIKRLTFKAFESEYKFMLIWLPEKMRVEGANRILKTLEEPPEKTILFLISQHPEELLTTIISRTQLFKVPAYTASEAATILHQRSGLPLDRCLMASEVAEGNLAQARWMLENSDEADQQLELFRNWMLFCYGFQVGDLLRITDQFAKEGREWQKGFFAYALYMIRQTLLMNHQPQLNRLTEGERTFLTKFSRFFHPGNYAVISNHINEASAHIERNGHAKIVFFDTSLLISDVFRKEKSRVSITRL